MASIYFLPLSWGCQETGYLEQQYLLCALWFVFMLLMGYAAVTADLDLQ